MARVNTGLSQRCFDFVTGRVIADTTDEVHVRTGSRGCDRLISSLAAGSPNQRPAEQGFAWLRQRLDTSDNVHVHTADDHNS
jgi:hypothetical protein